MKLTSSIYFELLLISFLIVFEIVFSGTFQKQLTYQNGKGWDGVDYSKMAEQIATQQPVYARAPFVYRIGTSFLAAKLFPGNLNYGFKLINICAGVAGIYILWFWLTLFVKNKIVRDLLTASYILYWQAPLRLSFYYPFHADPMALVFLFSGLIFLKYLIESYSFTKLAFFLAITIIGVFVREICLIPALILFLSKEYDHKAIFPNGQNFKDTVKSIFHKLFSRPVSSENRFIPRYFSIFKKLFVKNVYFLPLMCGITVQIITHFLVNKESNYSFFNTAFHWIYTKSIFMYLHAWFLAIGTILTIILYYYSENLTFLKNNKYILFYLLIIIFISIAGGSDTERLIMWSIPVIFVLIGNTVVKHQNIFKDPIILIFLIVTQLISIRAFLLIPDYLDDNSFQIPFLTPISNHFPLFNLWTIHGEVKYLLFSFAQYVTLALFLSYYIWGKDKNRKSF